MELKNVLGRVWDAKVQAAFLQVTRSFPVWSDKRVLPLYRTITAPYEGRVGLQVAFRSFTEWGDVQCDWGAGFEALKTRRATTLREIRGADQDKSIAITNQSESK